MGEPQWKIWGPIEEWFRKRWAKVLVWSICAIAAGLTSLVTAIADLQYDAERFRAFMGSGGRCTAEQCEAMSDAITVVRDDLRETRKDDDQLMRDVSRLQAISEDLARRIRDLERRQGLGKSVYNIGQ